MDYDARTKIALVNNFIGECTNNHVHVDMQVVVSCLYY